MEYIEERDKKRLTDSLASLRAFSRNTNGTQAWDEFQVAFGELGNVVSRLLAKKPQEDVSFSTGLMELDQYADRLRFSPDDDEVRRDFEVSLGNIEYRLKRLFGVGVH